MPRGKIDLRGPDEIALDHLADLIARYGQEDDAAYGRRLQAAKQSLKKTPGGRAALLKACQAAQDALKDESRDA